MLTHYVDLEVRMGVKEEQMCFLVTGLGNEDLILGYPGCLCLNPDSTGQMGQLTPSTSQLLSDRSTGGC